MLELIRVQERWEHRGSMPAEVSGIIVGGRLKLRGVGEKRDGRVAEEDWAHFERELRKLTAALLGRWNTTAARYLWRR